MKTITFLKTTKDILNYEKKKNEWHFKYLIGYHCKQAMKELKERRKQKNDQEK